MTLNLISCSHFGEVSFVPSAGTRCHFMSLMRMIYRHANEAACLGETLGVCQGGLAMLWVSLAESWHRHKAGRDSCGGMGRGGGMAFTGLHVDWWAPGECRPTQTSVRRADTSRHNPPTPLFCTPNHKCPNVSDGRIMRLLTLRSASLNGCR